MPESATTAPSAAYSRALTLGVITGLRSVTGLAALALAAQPNGLYATLAQAPSPWRLISTRPALIALCLAAAGEFVGDKLSITPPRTKPAPLAERMACGALVGALTCRAVGHSPAIGGVLGALGALGGSFGGYTYRVQAALAEDATAAIVALAVTRK
jgi:uncharacterized membrane protein